MGLVAVSLDAPGALAEEWADALLAAGAMSVDITAAKGSGAAALDEANPSAAAWRKARLTTLFATDADIDAALARVGTTVGRSVGRNARHRVPECDWVRRTRDQFRPVRATKRIWVVPSWCEAVDRSALNLTIDPGLAFGTGAHPSTRLCLRWLDENLEQGASVLDYGCGSGILAIAAAHLGAGAIVGVDIDEQALMTSRANARRNGAKARFMRPSSLRTSRFDVVVANILSGPLQRLASRLAHRARATIVLSGILEEQAADVASAYARWFNIGVWAREDGWVALAGSCAHES